MNDPSWASPGSQPEPPPAAPLGPPVPEGMPVIRPPAPGDQVPQPGYGPVVAPPPPGDGPDDATPIYYAMPDPNQNWGLNPNSGVRYEVLVPRPPRPQTVTVALVLTYVGVGIAMAYLLVNSLSQWADRDRLISDTAGRADASGVDASSVVGVLLVVVAVFWVLVAAGLVVCAAIANRGSNAARITLSVLMGVVGLYQLCGAISAGAVTVAASSGGTSANSPFAALNASSANIHWWSYVGSSLLAVTGLIVFVLLIVPPTNRYFSAGPGRRFAPGA